MFEAYSVAGANFEKSFLFPLKLLVVLIEMYFYVSQTVNMLTYMPVCFYD